MLNPVERDRANLISPLGGVIVSRGGPRHLCQLEEEDEALQVELFYSGKLIESKMGSSNTSVRFRAAMCTSLAQSTSERWSAAHASNSAISSAGVCEEVNIFILEKPKIRAEVLHN